MAAQVVKQLPEGSDWLYELKFDGYRALLLKDEERIALRSRKNKDLAGMYPAITLAGTRLQADQAVCGELRVTQPRVADTSRGSEAATDTC